MTLPAPSPYPALGGAPMKWTCEGSQTFPVGAVGGAGANSNTCVVTQWGTNPAAPVPPATVGVNNFPATPAYPTPYRTVSVDNFPAAGSTTNTYTGPPCNVSVPCVQALSKGSTQVVAGGFTLGLLLLAALLVMQLRSRA